MKRGGGKAKGGSFERWVCKRLSLWLSQGQRDDLIWRSAMSGGRASVQFKLGKVNRTQAGDLSSIDPMSARFLDLYYVECKSYRDLDVEAALFHGGRGNLYKFWADTVDKATRVGKYPMLVCRQHRCPEFVVLDFMGADTLGLNEVVIGLINSHPQPMYVFIFDAFVNNARPVYYVHSTDSGHPSQRPPEGRVPVEAVPVVSRGRKKASPAPNHLPRRLDRRKGSPQRKARKQAKRQRLRLEP